MTCACFAFFSLSVLTHVLFPVEHKPQTTPAPSSSVLFPYSTAVRSGQVRWTWICIAPRRKHTSKALRYGHAFSRDLTVLPARPRTSANGMNHTCLCLPSRGWYSSTNPGGMEGWVGLGGWLYLKQPVPTSLSSLFSSLFEVSVGRPLPRWRCGVRDRLHVYRLFGSALCLNMCRQASFIFCTSCSLLLLQICVVLKLPDVEIMRFICAIWNSPSGFGRRNSVRVACICFK